MSKTANSVRSQRDVRPVRKVPALVSLSNGAMRSGPWGSGAFREAWADTELITLGHTRPTPDFFREVGAGKGHDSRPAVDWTPALPDHVQVLLHLRYEKEIADDSPNGEISHLFINILRVLDVVFGISEQRKYTSYEVGADLQLANAMIRLGALNTADERRKQYQKVCNAGWTRCTLAKRVNSQRFRDLDLVWRVVEPGLKYISSAPKLNAPLEEVQAYYEPLIKMYADAKNIHYKPSAEAEARLENPLEEYCEGNLAAKN